MIAPSVQAFFADALWHQRRRRPHTIRSWRDTCWRLLPFLRDRTGLEPSALRMAPVDAPGRLCCLNYLEQDRGNSGRSRNLRLSALRSLLPVGAWRDPDSIGMVTRGLAMPMKRQDRKLIAYLTRAEIQALLATPDTSQWSGRRASAWLWTLYNRGTRVSAIIALRRRQVCFATSTFWPLTGTGRKERPVPLWPETARGLNAWGEELGEAPGQLACPHARGTALSRAGVDDLVTQAVQRAMPSCAGLVSQNLTPHVIRHTTALHLLPAGVDIAPSALWLGHDSIETPQGYLLADRAMQEQALEKLAPIAGGGQRFQADDPLLTCLASR